MKKLIGYSAAALGLYAAAAFALTNPATFAPRSFPTQQTHYERHVINVTSSGCSADTGQGQTNVFTTGSCSVKLGAVPYNAFIARAYQQITTGCNASSTCTLALGINPGGAGLVAAQSIATAAAGTALTVANMGILPTTIGAPQTGSNGGFDLWATVAQTGTAASAGTVVVIIEFFNSNDGGCTFVPLGATAGAC